MWSWLIKSMKVKIWAEGKLKINKSLISNHIALTMDAIAKEVFTSSSSCILMILFYFCCKIGDCR